MKVVVDLNVWASNAVGLGIRSEVFELCDDGCLSSLNENPPEELRDKLGEAVIAGPTVLSSLVEAG